MPDGTPVPTQDPYAEFGGSTAKPAASAQADPYAEFGGKTAEPTSVSPAAQPGAFQTRKGGPVQNVNTPPSPEEQRQSEVSGAQKGLHTAASVLNYTGLPGEEIVGAAKGIYETGLGGAELLSKGAHALGIGNEESEQLAAGDVSPLSEAMKTREGFPQKAGAFAEELAEWAGGDAALKETVKGLELFQKITKHAPWMIEQAEKLPKATKLFTAMGKGVAIGGTQSAVKEGDVGAAKAGAEGGALGAGAGEAVPAAVKGVAKQFGIGTTSEEDISKAAQFAKNNLTALKDWAKAQKPIAEAFEAKGEPKTLEEGVEKIREVRQDYWKKVTDIADKHVDEPFDATNVANAVRKLADNPAMKRFPEDQKALLSFANQYTSGSPNFTGEATVGDAMKEIKKYNAKLDTEGYWKKPPEARAAMEEADPKIAAWRTASNELRTSLFEHLKNAGEPDMAELRDTYGAIGNIERSLRGQINVTGRAKNVSLKKAIGVTFGIAHGGPGGAAAAALPILDAIWNDPVRVLNRAVGKAGEAGPVKQAIQAGFRAGTPVAKAAAGVAGEEAWVSFTDSGGIPREVHPEDVEAVKKADPGAKFN